MQLQSKPIPPEVGQLFDYLMYYAQRGDLGVVSVLDRETFETRFALMGRHGNKLVPLGFLSNTAGDEIIPPGREPMATVVVLEPDRWGEFVAYGGNDPREIDRWADDGGPHHG